MAKQNAQVKLPKDVQKRLDIQRKEPILSAIAAVEQDRNVVNLCTAISQKAQRLKEANRGGENMVATVRNQTKHIDELKQELNEAKEFRKRAERTINDKAATIIVMESDARELKQSLDNREAALISARVRTVEVREKLTRVAWMALISGILFGAGIVQLAYVIL